MSKRIRTLLFLGVVSILAIGFAVNPASATVPGTNERANVSSAGAETNSYVGGSSSISQDGRYVVFESDATNLVSGDTNAMRDVFLRDRNAGTTIRVSVSSAGVQSNGYSQHPRISESGKYVVYHSSASNLAGSGTPPGYEIYLYDVANATTELVSQSTGGGFGNGGSTDADVSTDGRYVVFQSAATNLVASGGSSSHTEIYVRDRQVSSTQLLTSGNTDSTEARIDCSGRFVTFHSAATNLVSGDTNGADDIFLADRLGASVTTQDLTIGANQDSVRPSISCNGNFIAFESVGSNLTAGDTNGFEDVFRYDRINGGLTKISLSSSSAQGNNDSAYADISGDGRYVVYHSNATNLVASDTNGTYDIFLTDTTSGTTQRIAMSSGGVEANGLNWLPAISADGKYVSYYSSATNLVAGDTNGYDDIFVSATGEDACTF
jgi:Tol biopolymer transport system component